MSDTPPIETITLLSGSHESREDGVCFLEAVAWFAGEPHGDHPSCVSPVLGAFGRAFNDGINDDARRTELLRDTIPLLVGTRGSDELEKRRSLRALDWLVRHWLPVWLDLVPALAPNAVALRDLPVVTESNAKAVGDVVRAASRDSAAAWDAAGAAAWAAAGDAARAFLRPTVERLQADAVVLLRELAAMTDEAEAAE